MSVITARNFQISTDGTTVSTASKGRILRVSEAGPAHASNFKGGTGRGCGVGDWQGYFMAYGHTPPLFPNDTFTLVCSLDNTNSASGDAICTGIDIVVPNEPERDGKNYVFYRVYFGAMGADLTFGSSPPSTDVSQAAMFCASGLPLKLDNVAEDEIIRSELRIRAAAPRYAKDTGWYSRTAGNLDWELDYRRRISSLGSLPAIGTLKVVKQYVTAALFWELSWGRVTEPFDVEIDRESNAIVAASVKLEMSAYYGTSYGHINNPATTQCWPEA
jgi:hypothetical protein